MASPAPSVRGNGPRRSVLDLSPLELACMNALWPLGEGTVREIQDWLATTRPRAYTTIMTIMDRLAHKGVVTREKSGRAYLYRPNLSAEEARRHALDQVVDGFFQGSTDELVAHISGRAPDLRGDLGPAPLKAPRVLPNIVSGDVPGPPATPNVGGTAPRPPRMSGARQRTRSARRRAESGDESISPEVRGTVPGRLDESLL